MGDCTCMLGKSGGVLLDEAHPGGKYEQKILNDRIMLKSRNAYYLAIVKASWHT